MNTFFKGKKLLVVGGTSGMGLAVARMVLEAGGSVVLTGNKNVLHPFCWTMKWNSP